MSMTSTKRKEPDAEISAQFAGRVLIPYKEAGRALGVEPGTVSQLVAAGKLEAKGSGRGRKVSVLSLLRYVHALPSSDVRPRAARLAA